MVCVGVWATDIDLTHASMWERRIALVDTDGSALGLWQRNMIAVRAEVEIAFAPRDAARFVKLTHSGTIPTRARRGPKKTTTTPQGYQAAPAVRAGAADAVSPS